MLDVIVLAAAGFLLLSMGGAIVAAPLSVPLLIRAARRHPGRAWRATATVIAGATAAEVGWAVTYFTTGEAQPWIWLVPLTAAGAVAVATLGRPTPSVA